MMRVNGRQQTGWWKSTQKITSLDLLVKIFLNLNFYKFSYLDKLVFIGGYGPRNPDAAEYIDGVCHDAAVISGLSIGYAYWVAGNE